MSSGYYILAGKYGTFGMPFKFGIFLIVLTFLASKRIIKGSIPLFFLIVIGTVTSDSRISLACFFLVLFFINSRVLFFSLLLSPFVLLLASPKMASILSSSQSLGNDGSLMMRVVNFQNYIEWLNSYNFIFGHGALAFLEFGIAYGVPGPIDMIGIRLFSEFGVPLTTAAFIIFVLFIYKIFDFRIFIAFLGFFIAYGLFNEGVVSLRAGNLFWFALGVFYSNFLSEKKL